MCVTVFAAIRGYPTVKCFVIGFKDRLPDRHERERERERERETLDILLTKPKVHFNGGVGGGEFSAYIINYTFRKQKKTQEK